MMMNKKLLLATFLVTQFSYGFENNNAAPIILPGAPGEESKNLDLISEDEISNLFWNKSDLLDYLDVFVESCSSYLLPKISFPSNSSQLN